MLEEHSLLKEHSQTVCRKSLSSCRKGSSSLRTRLQPRRKTPRRRRHRSTQPQTLKDNGRAHIHVCRRKTIAKRSPLCRRPECRRSRNDLHLPLLVSNPHQPLFLIRIHPRNPRSPLCLKFFLQKTSAKSHVKPKKQLTHCSTSTYEWHFSYTQSRKIEQEEKSPRRKAGAFAFNFQKRGEKYP